MKVDIVVAVRNEEEALPVFVRSLKALSLPDDVELGCIFVEDSSTDDTIPILRKLSAVDPLIRYICLERGLGQAPAIALGMAHSHADAIIMMDVDGGHPLELVPRMISAYREGSMVVQAVRKNLRLRKGFRDLGTKIFNSACAAITGIDTRRQNVFYRLIARPLAQKLLRNNRWKHFLRIRYKGSLASLVAYIEFEASERHLGVSKYNLKRLILFAIDGIFASISFERFLLGILCLYSLSFLLLACKQTALGLSLLLTATGCIIRFWKFSRNDIFALMIPREVSPTIHVSRNPSNNSPNIKVSEC